MKKILLIGFIIFYIFQMVVMAIDIDIGSLAIDRPGAMSATNRTYINERNPANANGEITTVEIWANVDMTDVEVATFYNVSGTNFSSRDSTYIGNVTSGSKHTASGLNITVQEGDYIGIYFNAGAIEKTTTDDPDNEGFWHLAGDQIPCTDATFTHYTNSELSLYGIGTTEVGWPHKWDTKTISKWNIKEFTKWNGLE